MNHLLSKRFLWGDIIRVIAIFFVVFSHTLTLLPKPSFENLLIWIPYLYSQFGVPLFVMISGSLLLGKRGSNVKFFKKRVTNALIPWISWIIIYILLDKFYYNVTIASISEALSYSYRMFFSRFWFFPMIWGLYLLTPLINVFLKKATKQDIFYSLALWFFAFSLLPYFYFLVSGHTQSLDSSLLRLVMQHTGLFLLGYILTRTTLLRLNPKTWGLIVLASMFITFLAVIATSYNATSINMSYTKVFSPTMLPAVPAMFMLLYYLAKKWDKIISKRGRSIWMELSTSALGIYLVHEIVQQIIMRKIFDIEPFFYSFSPIVAVPLQTSIIFIISFVIVLILRRIPIIRLAT